MLMTVAELRQFVNTDETDEVLEFRIQALESFICKYTNNSFVNRETGVVEFPPDVKMGAINLLKWDFGFRDKVGIASESISRHSVSYSGVSGDDSVGGYPAGLVGFLRLYVKARF